MYRKTIKRCCSVTKLSEGLKMLNKHFMECLFDFYKFVLLHGLLKLRKARCRPLS